MSHTGGRLVGDGGVALPGSRVWPDLADVHLYGGWPSAQLLTVVRGDTRLMALGHRLPAAGELSADADRLGRGPGACLVVALTLDAVLIYPDLAGQFPAYFSRCGDRTMIAQHPGVIAALTGNAADPLSAAIGIACSAVLPLVEGRSPFTGVGRVEGGQVLRVTRRGSAVRVHHPRTPEPGAGLADSAAGLRRALDAAIGARCAGRGRITADFSGGVDSTSIAMLAARTRPVEGVVYHHEPAADLHHAVRAAAMDDGVSLSVVHGDRHTLPYQELDHLAAEPFIGLLAVRRAALRLDWAAARGSDLHLTGEGGDALLWSGPSYLADLPLGRLWRDSRALAGMRQLSMARLAGRAAGLARTSAARALTRLARSLERPSGAPASAYDAVAWWNPPGEALGWLARRIRSPLADLAGDQVTRESASRYGRPSAHATLVELRESAAAQRFLRELGAGRGVAVHAPLLDDEVVAGCLRLPAHLRVDTGGYKPLLGRALTGAVPGLVTGRATKGNYLAEEYQGARRASGRLFRLLDGSRLADLGVIEPSRVHASLTKLVNGVPVPLGQLNRLLATEVWLRSLERRG